MGSKIPTTINFHRQIIKKNLPQQQKLTESLATFRSFILQYLYLLLKFFHVRTLCWRVYEAVFTYIGMTNQLHISVQMSIFIFIRISIGRPHIGSQATTYTM